MYRNGEQYGQSYSFTGNSVRIAQARFVFGVRSSAFVGQPVNGAYSPAVTAIAGSRTYQNQFYSGSIQSASFIKGALLSEEVAALYRSGFYSPEIGCHCATVCPLGSNRHSGLIPVPCSGQGVCRLSGACTCSPGYSGEACQYHCADVGGCCVVDDDCVSGKICDLATNACAR